MAICWNGTIWFTNWIGDFNGIHCPFLLGHSKKSQKRGEAKYIPIKMNKIGMECADCDCDWQMELKI